MQHQTSYLKYFFKYWIQKHLSIYPWVKKYIFLSLLYGFMDSKVTRSESSNLLLAVVLSDTFWQENNFWLSTHRRKVPYRTEVINSFCDMSCKVPFGYSSLTYAFLLNGFISAVCGHLILVILTPPFFLSLSLWVNVGKKRSSCPFSGCPTLL